MRVNDFMGIPEISINKFCPRSGKPVQSDSITMYRGVRVGFCNPGCREDFASNIKERPDDRNYFNVLIKEHDLNAKPVNEALETLKPEPVT